MKRVLLILITLSSCKLTEKNITGTYQDYSNIPEYSTFLRLNRDHSFYFEQNASLLIFQANGNWKFDNDTLFLFAKDTLALINHDTSDQDLSKQKFVIKGRKLIKVLKNEITQLELKQKP